MSFVTYRYVVWAWRIQRSELSDSMADVQVQRCAFNDPMAMVWLTQWLKVGDSAAQVWKTQRGEYGDSAVG